MSIARLRFLRLGPIGLQRRIMLYAAVGLAILFVSWGVISARGVDRISALLVSERLTAADSVAAVMGLDLKHVVNDMEEELEPLWDSDDATDLQRLTEEALDHLMHVDEFEFFSPTRLVVLGPTGDLLAAAPVDEPPSQVEIQSLHDEIGHPAEPVIHPATELAIDGESFAVASVPLAGSTIDDVGTAYVLLQGANSTEPLHALLPSSRYRESDDVPEYHIAVVDAEGITILNIGPHGTLGEANDHLPALRPLMNHGGGAMTHDAGAGTHDGTHVVAAVPIPYSDMFLVLDQENDKSLSVPSEIRYQFIVIGIVGFFGALLVAWFTTRRVVRPTLELVSATERMAAGDLASPVDVKAQDEIAGLAENVETLRIRLADALSELEASNRELGDRVRQRTGRLTQALRQVISAQEGERERVARDLHDDVAQQLIVLTRSIDNFKTEAACLDPAAESRLDEISDLARGSLATIRRVSRDLRPSVLDDLGLVAALRWIASEASSHSGLDVTVRSKVESPTVSPEVGLGLFRIAQEAVHNVERHSGATTATITLAQADGVVTLTVEDDGRGFDVPTRFRDNVRAGRLGLLGMNERAELLGGRLTIESKPGKGARVIAEVPVDVLEALPAQDYQN